MKTGMLVFMRRILSILAVSAIAFTEVARAENGATRYYVQLVQGTDSDHPPQAGSRHVGARLTGTLRGVFRWRNYWEICQRKVEVFPGRTRKVDLANGREAEVDLTRPDKRTVAAFQNGKMVNRTVGPAGESITMIGGNRDQTSGWFIVVRRDKPGE